MTDQELLNPKALEDPITPLEKIAQDMRDFDAKESRSSYVSMTVRESIRNIERALIFLKDVVLKDSWELSQRKLEKQLARRNEALKAADSGK